MVILKSRRYGVPVHSKHETVKDAIGAAWHDREYNMAYGIEITDDSGNVLVPHDGLVNAIDAYQAEHGDEA